MPLTINCGVLIDGTGKDPIKNCSIEIDDGKIVRINQNKKKGSGDELIDWNNFTVIPGMFDCHDHITEDLGMEYLPDEQMKFYDTIRAVKNCNDILFSGMTTVRDTGGKYGINLEMREAIKNGSIEGPDIITPRNRISRTGYPKYQKCREADGVDEVIKAVREEQKAGADFIKLMITGVGAGDPVQAEYSKEEIMAGIEEAHRLGLTVGVHAHGGLATTQAIDCGVDVIEHGTYLSDDDLKKMKQKNIYLVVTLPVFHFFKDIDSLPSLNDDTVHDKYANLYLDILKAIKKAKDYNLLFSLGGDNHHGDVVGNIKALKDCGFSPLEAISILTRDGARICGLENLKGTIEVDKIADIVAIAGSPLDNIKDFKNVKGIIKGGTVKLNKK